MFVGLLTLPPPAAAYYCRINFGRVATCRRVHVLAMGSSALMTSEQVQATSQASLAESDSAAGTTCSGLAREAERQQYGGRDRRAAGWSQASRSWHPTVCCGDGKCFQP